MGAGPENCLVCEERDEAQSRECEGLLAALPGVVGPWPPRRSPGADADRERPPAGDNMPPCRMFLDAESLSHITGTSVLGWRAGGALLGCIADMDVDRRVLLVTNAEDSYLIADLVVNHGPGGDERPQVGRDRLRCQAGRR